MKIAILSDIHGNLEALRSAARDFDELWVLGDLVHYGPNPAEVVDFVREHAAVVVRGNHDHAAATGEDPRCSAAFREMARATQAYTGQVLSAAQKAYLRELPLTARREADGKRFFLCHATPSDLFRYLRADAAAWAEEAAAVKADILLVGHTHVPFTLNAGGLQVVNPGSTGQPKHGAPEACFALFEDGAITLPSRRYPVQETVRKVLALPLEPGIREQLAAVLSSGGPPSAAC
mgnify:CR=1 FL=1